MSHSPLRILHIASWYPSRLHATLGNFVERHIRAISTISESQVLAVYTDAHTWNINLEDSTEDGLNVLRVFHPASSKALNRKRAFKKALDHLRTGSTLPFDLVHLHVIYPHGWMARHILKKYGIPYVITEHWTGYHNGISIGTFQKWHDKKTAVKSAVLAPVTQHLAEAMQKLGLKGNYSVIPNVVDTKLFQPVSKEKNPFRFIHISSLVDDHKNVSGILRVFARHCTDVNDTHLSIVGDGEIAPYLKLAKEFGIPEDRLSVEGEQPIEEIALRVNISHCLLLFSNYENLPCVIVEAMAAGIPTISTNVGGIKEHLINSLGVLIDKGDEPGLRKAMGEMVKSHSTFRESSLRKYALDHFSIEAIAKNYYRLYQTALVE